MRSLRGGSAWALLVLAAAAACAALLLIWEGRGLTLFVDEWGYGYLKRPGWSFSGLVAPDNGHLAFFPVAIDKLWLDIFGATTTLPLRLLAIALHIATAFLLYALLRRDLGPWGALPPAILLLFLGAAADIFLGSHAIPIQLAVATGLGALLAAGAGRKSLDLLAAALLAVGIASNGFALPFVAAVAVAVVLSAAGRRRLWIAAVPLAVYALWWIAEGHDADGGFAIRNIAGVAAFAFDSLAAALAALTGLFPDPGASGQSFVLGPGQALAGIVVSAAIVLLVLGHRPPRAAWPALAGLLVVWVATALVAGPDRQPESERYLYAGAILLLLTAAPAIGRFRFRREATIALAAVCALALLPNLRELHYAGQFFRLQSEVDRATLGAIDLVGARAPDGYPVEVAASQVPGTVEDMRGTVASYRESRERFGSPAFSVAEIAAASSVAREAADRTIARMLGLGLRPARGGPAPLPAPLSPAALPGAAGTRGGCLGLRPLLAGETALLTAPRGGLWLRARSGVTSAISMGRFADGLPIGVGTALGGRAIELPFGPGEASRGWRVGVSPSGPAEVCRAVSR